MSKIIMKNTGIISCIAQAIDKNPGISKIAEEFLEMLDFRNSLLFLWYFAIFSDIFWSISMESLLLSSSFFMLDFAA